MQNDRTLRCHERGQLPVQDTDEHLAARVPVFRLVTLGMSLCFEPASRSIGRG